MSSVRRPAIRAGAEVLLVVVLLGAWVISWLSIIRSFDSLTTVGRALFLVNSFTAENLTVALILGLIAVVLLPLRHRSPVVALILVGGVVIAVQWFYPLVFSNSIVMQLVVGIAILWTTWKVKQWWWWVGLVLVPLLLANGVRTFQVNARVEAIQATPSSTTLSVSDVLQEVLFFTVVIIGGLAVRRIFEQRAELEKRNRELEAERAKVADAAVLDERLRISRELHDVVAHHVTTMTVHAGAARQVVDSSPENAKESLRHIESAGRDAVKELHQLLGFLRNSDGDEDADDDRAPTPSLRHLPTLRDSFGSELTCEVKVEGDVSTVPAAVDVSAYRIIQEALTNSMKHSTATEVSIDVKVEPDGVSLAISDEGEGLADEKSSGGHGLVGMRERASLHGGEVEVGPDSRGRGWHVRAELPFRTTS